MAGLAVLYALPVSVWLAAPYRDLAFFAVLLFVTTVIALPMAFTSVVRFRIACLTVAAVLLPLGFIGVMAGMFVYWPAVVPLALAAVPLTGRYRLASLAVVAFLLLGTPWAFRTWIL